MKLIYITLLTFVGISIGVVYWIWNYKISTKVSNAQHTIWIKPTDTVDSLETQLQGIYPEISKYILKLHLLYAFNTTTIKPGKYNVNGIKKIRGVLQKISKGYQEKIVLHINSQILYPEDYFKYLDLKLFYNQFDFKRIRNNPHIKSFFGTDTTNLFYCLIPRDYHVYWTITPEEFADSLVIWYRKYWNPDRIQQAQKLHLSVPQVITLASIVQSESRHYSDQQKIARVYLNRLHIQMPLQADPTLVFANRLHGVKRLLNRDKTIESPYNTYKYKGLPPGPIALTYTGAIESVLHCDTNAYLFFCARPDGTGFSDFSIKYIEHLQNAKSYQQQLNHSKIYR